MRTATAQAKEDLKQVSFTKIIRYFLLSFGAIALFVGAFVIFNTLSITVAQRIREFATLRTIGASRRQLLTSVTLEALVIGVLASLLGLFGGLLLARGVNALFKASNNDLPTTSLILSAKTVLISLTVGIVVTLVAGIFPAMRATKVPPIAAVREGATLPPGRLAKYTPIIALVIVVLSVALLAYGLFGHGMSTVVRLLSLAVGCLFLFIGVALVSPRLVPKLAGGLRPVAKWVMFVGALFVYPIRIGTWLVRGALFGRDLGLGGRVLRFVGGFLLMLLVGPGILLAASWALGAATRQGAVLFRCRSSRGDRGRARHLARDPGGQGCARRRLCQRPAGCPLRSGHGQALGRERAQEPWSHRSDGRRADDRARARDVHRGPCQRHEVLEPRRDRGSGEGPVHADRPGRVQPVRTERDHALARSPEVEVASGVRGGLAKIAGQNGQITGIDPKTITKVYKFDWKKGSDATVHELGDFGAIVEKQFADDANL